MLQVLNLESVAEWCGEELIESDGLQPRTMLRQLINFSIKLIVIIIAILVIIICIIIVAYILVNPQRL
jgi:hypothetical protein